MEKKYRLITRDDFDGLVCAVLLKKLDLVDDILFVHPRDMQHNRVMVTSGDISANLPYVPGVYMAFDHHLSESRRVGPHTNFICVPEAPSAAQVIYDYFNMGEKFPGVFEEILQALNKADTADFTAQDILNPQGWVLFNFILDPKTGFTRFHDFQTGHEDLVRLLINSIEGMSIDDILNLPDVQERVMLYQTYQDHFKDQIERCATVCQNLVVVDLREEEIIYPGNRFLVYALYPNCNLSLMIEKDTKSERITFSLGRSILNRTSTVDAGAVMAEYNGGGHTGAGTCQSTDFDVEKIKMDLIAAILMASKKTDTGELSDEYSRVSGQKDIQHIRDTRS